MRVRAPRGRKRLIPAPVDIEVGERPANLRSILRTSNNSYSNDTDYSRCTSFGRIVKIRLIPPRPDAIPGKVTVLEADDSSSVKDLVFLDPIAPESIIPYTTCAPCASEEKTSFEYQAYLPCSPTAQSRRSARKSMAPMAFSDPEVRSCLLESPLGDNNLEEEESEENTVTADTSPVNSSEDINSCDVANDMSPTTSTADNARNICVSAVDVGISDSTLPVYSSSNSFSPCASLKKLNIVSDSPAHKCRRRSVKFTVAPAMPNWGEADEPQINEESTVATVKPQNVTREKPAVKNNRRRSHYFPPPEQDRIAHLEDSEMPVLEVMTGNCPAMNPNRTAVEEDVTQSSSSEIEITMVEGGEKEANTVSLSVSEEIQQEQAQPSNDLVMKGKKRGRSTCISMPVQQPALTVLQQVEEPEAENSTHDVRPDPTIDSQSTGTTGYSLRPRKAALQNDSSKPAPSRTGRGRRGRPTDVTKTRILEQELESEGNSNTVAPSSMEVPIAPKLAEAQTSGVISQENTSSEKMVTKDPSVHVMRKSRRSCVLKPANKDFHRTLFDVEANQVAEVQQL